MTTKCITCVPTRRILYMRIRYTFRISTDWQRVGSLVQCAFNFLVKRRNPVCDIIWLMIPNLVESSLMGKIQEQSVSTYVLDSLFVSLSVLMYSTVCLYSH